MHQCWMPTAVKEEEEEETETEKETDFTGSRLDAS